MKIKEKFAQRSENSKRRKLEKEKHRTELKAEEARIKQEQVMAEKRAIEDEKNRLLGLDDKSLMVELICAVRGFYSSFKELNERFSDLSDYINELEYRISIAEAEIVALKFSPGEDD